MVSFSDTSIGIKFGPLPWMSKLVCFICTDHSNFSMLAVHTHLGIDRGSICAAL